MKIDVQKLTLDFGEFRLEIDTEQPGMQPLGEPQMWVYNNEAGDGLEVSPEEFGHMLKQYYRDFM